MSSRDNDNFNDNEVKQYTFHSTFRWEIQILANINTVFRRWFIIGMHNLNNIQFIAMCIMTGRR